MKRFGNQDSDVPFLCLLAIFYVAIGFVYLILPIAGDFGRMLLGSSLLPLDVLLNTGVLEWGHQSLFSAHLNFFDWNAGFPLSNTLAATENLVGWQLIFYPLRALGAGVAAAYNISLLFSFIVSGVGAALLARRLGTNRWGAAAAGFIFAYGPFHLANMMNIQTMAACWVPYAIFFLDRYIEKPNTFDANALILTFVLTALSSIYFGVFLAIVLPLYVLLTRLTGRYRVDGNVARRLALIGFLAFVAISPIIIPYLRFASVQGHYQTSASEMTDLSMEWAAPLRTPSFQQMWAGSFLRWENQWDGQPAFFGFVCVALMLTGILQYRRGGTIRPVVLILVGLSLVAYLLALGPFFKTAGRGPSKIIYWVPMPGRLWLLMPAIRWLSRFFFFAWLGGALLAGLAFNAIERNFSGGWRRFVPAFVILLLIIEYWPARWLVSDSVRVSAPVAMSDAYPIIAREGDRGGVIDLPTMDSSAPRKAVAGLYLYGASGHLRRIVALHGRKIPALTDSLIQAGNELPEEEGRNFLLSHGVTRIVVHRGIGNESANARLIAALIAARFDLVFNGRESAVFALAPVRRTR